MTNYDKLINTLKEVFMLDKAELDFGIYRIINQKRKDIEQFLEVDLVPQVHKVLSESLSVDKQALQKELDNAIKSAQALGADPNKLPKVQDLKKRLGEAADMVGIENEVFSLLANFFKRYFDNGDFISMRRYKKDVYAIPYEGEEVKLHWANADQYYIKTSEYFKVYRFKLANGKTVAFELIEASTEQNNNKTQGDKERRFAIYTDKDCEVVGDEFKIYFIYEPADKKIKQSVLLGQAFDAVKTQIPQDFSDLLSLRSTEKDKQRTLLQKHLLDYTARNTFDYFIHKDLGGFLTRELDFYIKNEVLFIDDLNTRDEQEFLKQLSKIKAIKKIGEKIITFLAQLENFQKKLWLKKKMVVECNYCITLDRVPKDLYAEIISNDAQIKEWIKLFAIDEIKTQAAGGLFPENKPGFSNPLTLDFLNQNQFLVLDTAFFSETFKWKLIGSIEKFDDRCDGLLINSENFQALNLLKSKYLNQIKCTYIDPPYNTGKDGFPYKDGFQSGSWLSLMVDRLNINSRFLTDEGVLLTSLDDRETHNFKRLLEDKSIEIDLDATLVWNTEGHTDNQLDIKVNHEYVIIGGKRNKHPSIGMVIDPNTRAESNLWKGFAENSITKNGSGNPHSTIELPIGFPLKQEKIDLAESIINDDFLKEIETQGFITRDITSKYDVSYPIRLDKMEGDNHKLTRPCRVMSGWANANKLKKYIETGFKPIIEEDGIISFYISENGVIYYYKEREAARNIVSVLRNMGTTEKMRSELEDMGLSFKYPKPKELIEYLLSIGTTSNNDIVLDYFSGSGTTGHAVINHHRKNNYLKYILVEMGEHFYNVILPRIQKVVYSKDWKDGKPVSREGISHCLKYMRLESYEDTLNNLALKQTKTQELALEMNPRFKEGYMLNYMLDVEAKESLLNLEWFVNPFNCYLNITKDNELQPTKVDLVETFNYLIGLVVENYAVPKEGYVVVTGKNLAGESILVVWRDCTQHNSKALNQFLKESKYNPLVSEYDRIYVNGDNNVENLKTGDERWKVVLIEEEFGKRMFEQN
jgi:adenine-specific DNA-methyltransferase